MIPPPYNQIQIPPLIDHGLKISVDSLNELRVFKQKVVEQLPLLYRPIEKLFIESEMVYLQMGFENEFEYNKEFLLLDAILEYCQLFLDHPTCKYLWIKIQLFIRFSMKYVDGMVSCFIESPRNEQFIRDFYYRMLRLTQLEPVYGEACVWVMADILDNIHAPNLQGIHIFPSKEVSQHILTHFMTKDVPSPFSPFIDEFAYALFEESRELVQKNGYPPQSTDILAELEVYLIQYPSIKEELFRFVSLFLEGRGSSRHDFSPSIAHKLLKKENSHVPSIFRLKEEIQWYIMAYAELCFRCPQCLDGLFITYPYLSRLIESHIVPIYQKWNVLKESGQPPPQLMEERYLYN